MRVVYNGVDLGVLKTEVYEFESVYDESGVDYLYTRVTVVVRCVVNGFVRVQNGPLPNGPFVSYRFTGPNLLQTGGIQPTGAAGGNVVRAAPNLPVDSDGIGPPAATGVSAPGVGNSFEPPPLRVVIPDSSAPVVSHATVRQRLAFPGGKLYVFAGDGGALSDLPPKPEALSLESPLPGRKCDCKNGPFPRVLAVPEVMAGDRTFLLDFAVETYINEGPENNVNPSGILLSHRFSQSHGLTDDHRTSITTNGLAVFRTDLVYSIPQNPDYMRRVLFMPIPQGFCRSIPVVRGREDVTGVEYEYTDVQQAVNFVAGPYARAVRISAVHRQAIIADADVLQGALSAYERILGIAANKNFARLDPELGHPAAPARQAAPARSGGGGLAGAMRSRWPGASPGGIGGGRLPNFRRGSRR